MSDYLANLGGRTFGWVPVIRPRLAQLFEPQTVSSRSVFESDYSLASKISDIETVGAPSMPQTPETISDIKANQGARAGIGLARGTPGMSSPARFRVEEPPRRSIQISPATVGLEALSMSLYGLPAVAPPGTPSVEPVSETGDDRQSAAYVNRARDGGATLGGLLSPSEKSAAQSGEANPLVPEVSYTGISGNFDGLRFSRAIGKAEAPDVSNAVIPASTDPKIEPPLRVGEARGILEEHQVKKTLPPTPEKPVQSVPAQSPDRHGDSRARAAQTECPRGEGFHQWTTDEPGVIDGPAEKLPDQPLTVATIVREALRSSKSVSKSGELNKFQKDNIEVVGGSLEQSGSKACHLTEVDQHPMPSDEAKGARHSRSISEHRSGNSSDTSADQAVMATIHTKSRVESRVQGALKAEAERLPKSNEAGSKPLDSVKQASLLTRKVLAQSLFTDGTRALPEQTLEVHSNEALQPQPTQTKDLRAPPRQAFIRPRIRPYAEPRATVATDPDLKSTQAPVVHVTIGRIEVRAISAPNPAPRQKFKEQKVSTLGEYLKQRSGVKG